MGRVLHNLQGNEQLMAYPIKQKSEPKHQPARPWTQKILHSHWFWIYLFIVIAFTIITIIDALSSGF